MITTDQSILIWGLLMCIIIYLVAKLNTTKYYTGIIIAKNLYPFQGEYKFLVKYTRNSIKTKEITVTKEVFDKYKEGEEITVVIYF